MKNYDVIVSENLKKLISISATSREEAEELALERWIAGDIFLDDEDFEDVKFSATANVNNKITVLVIDVNQMPREQRIKNTIESLQDVIGGNIDVQYPFEDNVALISNADAKIYKLKLNRGIHSDTGDLEDVIKGKFLLIGTENNKFIGLSHQQLKKYKIYFEKIETFFSI